MKINTRTILLLMLFLLTACNIFDSNKQIIGRYYITKDKFGKALSYKVNTNGDFLELITTGFGKVGYDANYIIVEVDQYEYLIIPIYKNFTYSPEKGILGPMNLKEFDIQKEKLKIKASFTINSDN